MLTKPTGFVITSLFAFSVLAQPPTVRDLLGVGMVTVAVAIHEQPTGQPSGKEHQCSTPG